MPRNIKKRSKITRKQQTARLLNINQVNHQSHPAIGEEASIYQLTAIEKVQNRNRLLEKQLTNATANCRTTHRRIGRLKKAVASRKLDLKKLKAEAYRLRSAVSRLNEHLLEVQRDADSSISMLQNRIESLINVQKDLIHQKRICSRRCRRLQHSKRKLKQKVKQMAHKRPERFRLMKKGKYTGEARSLARLMVAAGAAEAKVGTAIISIGNVLGVTVDRQMNKRSVQRFILEQGIAADVQLVYEIFKSGRK